MYILTWKRASRHNGVQFFISHLTTWLRTRRFSEPTFRPFGATNHWKKTQCFGTFLLFRAPESSFFGDFLFLIFFLLFSSLLFSSLSLLFLFSFSSLSLLFLFSFSSLSLSLLFLFSFSSLSLLFLFSFSSLSLLFLFLFSFSSLSLLFLFSFSSPLFSSLLFSPLLSSLSSLLSSPLPFPSYSSHCQHCRKFGF